MMSQKKEETKSNQSMSLDASFSFLSALTTEELRIVLKFTQSLLQQPSLQATPKILFQSGKDAVVRCTPQELKDRAYGYLASFKNMSGADYILAMLRFPRRQYHLSQFLYTGLAGNCNLSIFTDEQGIALPGISIAQDLSLNLPATDAVTLRDISIRLNVISEQKAIAHNDGNYALVEDLCDEEEKLLSYVRKSKAVQFLDDRARKDYHLVLKAIKRVIKKIRTDKDIMDEEVADYIKKHIVTGIYCYWDE
jgi:hypothetical protein